MHKIKLTLPSQSTLLAGLFLSATLYSTYSQAAGFQVTENRAAGIGTSHADNAAAQDPSVLANNPAGLAYLDGTRATLTGVGVYGKFQYRDNGSTNINGGRIDGNDGGNPGGFTPIAANFISHRLNERATVGFGIYAPYGLPTKYQEGWVGRYHALKTDLKTVNFTPSFAFKASERLSLGVGLVAEYANAKFTNNIGTGSSASAPLSSSVPCNPGMQAICSLADGLLAQAGGATPNTEGKVGVKMHSWGWGYNLGAMFDLNQDARVGVSYRSRVRQELDGDVQVDYPLLGLHTRRAASTRIDMPEIASLSYYQNLLPNLSVMADLSWTRWSRFNEVRLKFDDPGLPDVVVPQNWRNTTRIAVGSEYRLNEQHTLRAGAALDPSPVSDATRTPRIPDADRVWLSLGYGYNLNKHVALDVGYAHLFVKDSSVSDNRSAMTGGTLNGSYRKGRAEIIGVSLRQKF